MRDKTNEHLSVLIRQIEDDAGFLSRRAASEELNQAMRRLQQCSSTDAVAAWLVDSTASYCGQAALFEVLGTRVRGVRSRSLTSAGAFEELEASLEEAPALAHSIKERDTVIAIGTPAEISPRIVSALDLAPGEKVYLYPIVIQEEVVAILCATAGEQESVDGAALELLTHAAARAAQILTYGQNTAGRRQDPELVVIKGVDMQAHRGAPAGDIRRQAAEARARWFARAEVARLRVFQRASLEKGRAERNIYSALKPQIDAARRAYGQDFLAVSPVIADYLHKELVGLAHDDANLLGPEYPGSLV